MINELALVDGKNVNKHARKNPSHQQDLDFSMTISTTSKDHFPRPRDVTHQFTGLFVTST